MSLLFLKILNMSISASYVALAVLLLRLVFRKAPKWINVLLWGFVAFRLICPFSLGSVFSLIPSVNTVGPQILTDKTPAINSGIPILNNTLNPIISETLSPNPANSVNPMQVIVAAVSAVWLIGVAVMLIYALTSYIKLRRRIGTAVLYGENIYQSENITSPFVLGVIRPKIYMPFGMNEQDISYVVAHEQAHVKRKDHLWKPLGFLILSVYWFNPLAWVAYILLCRDIESACDEKVIRSMDRESRGDYSQALLSCSTNRRLITACPIAFGETGVKSRVKSVLSYKKPAFWIIVIAIVACVAVAVCFLTNPVEEGSGNEFESFLGKGVYSLSVGEESKDMLVISLKYALADGRYSVSYLPASEKEYIGDGLIDYDGALGQHRIMIKFSDAELSDGLREKLPAGEVTELYNGSVRILAKVAYPSDHGFVLYLGFDRSITVDPQSNRDLNTLLGGISIKVGLEPLCEIPYSITGKLPSEHPEYFGLNTEKGLTVYYWQIAKDLYRCSLAETPENVESFKEMAVSHKGISVEQMRSVLETYTIERDKITLVPVWWVYSSYYYEITEEYAEAFSDLFWSAVPNPYYRSLIYFSPAYSYVMQTNEVPFVQMDNANRLYDLSGKQLGSLCSVDLNETDFVDSVGTYGEEYRVIADWILQKTVAAYKVEPLSPQAIDLCYVIVQSDGTTLLVYGHYNDGRFNNEIRWIYSIQ